MKKLVLTFITLLLAVMGSLVMAQDIPLTKTIILTRPLSQDTTLWTGKEYKFYLPNYFKFVKQDSTWQELTVQKSGCEMEEVFTFTDSGKTISYKEICAQVDTIPAHWEVIDVIDSSITPIYTIAGTSNMTNSKASIKNDSLVVWLNEIGTGNIISNVSININTGKDSTTTPFELAYTTKIEVFEEIEAFESEATAGEPYFFEVQKGISQADTTADLFIEVPDFIDSVVSTKELRTSWLGESILAISVKGEGTIPLDSTELKSYTFKSDLLKSDHLKSDVLKSEKAYTGTAMQLKATVVSGGVSTTLFDKTIPILKSGSETTAIAEVTSSDFAYNDLVNIVRIDGTTINTGIYGEILRTIPVNQIIFITCPTKDITKKVIKIQ